MLMASFFPNKGVALVAIGKQDAVHAAPLGWAIVARRATEYHLLLSVADAPVAASHAVVAWLEQMTM